MKKMSLWVFSLNNKEFSTDNFPSLKAALVAGHAAVKENPTDELPGVVHVAQAESPLVFSFFADGRCLTQARLC